MLYVVANGSQATTAQVAGLARNTRANRCKMVSQTSRFHLATKRPEILRKVSNPRRR